MQQAPGDVPRVARSSDVLVLSELDRNAAHCGQDLPHGTYAGTGIDAVELLAIEVDTRVFHGHTSHHRYPQFGLDGSTQASGGNAVAAGFETRPGHEHLGL